MRGWTAALTMAGIALAAWWALAPVPRRLPPGGHSLSPPRHVVFISLDTTRADALGPWGGVHTPAADALARQGVVFRRAVSAAPTTLVSHSSLFTGLHPHHHGVPSNNHVLSDDALTLTELAREAGWRTAAFLGALPIGEHSGFTQGFEHVDERFTMARSSDGVVQAQRPGDEVTRAALAWLDATPRDPDGRLFLFVHYFDAHAPYGADPATQALHGVGAAPPHAGQMPAIFSARDAVRSGVAPPDRVRELIGLYRAGVTQADAAVADLLAGLQARGLLDDALVVLTADHGETFDRPEEPFDHGETVYQDTLHVPLILRLPGDALAGRVIDDVVASVDLFPTLLDLLRLPAPPSDGRSLVPLLVGPGLPPRPAFAEATKPHQRAAGPGWANERLMKAVVDDDLSLHLDPRRHRAWLYDLTADPAESTDLTGRRPADAARLKAALTGWRDDAAPLPTRRVQGARVRADLEVLGYVE